MTQKKRNSASSAAYFANKYELLGDVAGIAYSLKSSNPQFDRITWHTPEFVCPGVASFVIPLGNSSAEALVSLYGLRYITTYTGNLDQTWKDMLQEFVSKPDNAEQAKMIVSYLHAAATMCYLKVDKCVQIEAVLCNPTLFCQMCQSVEQYDLVDAFRKKN